MHTPIKMTLLTTALFVLVGWGAAPALANEAKDTAQTNGNDEWEILFDGTSTDAFRGWKMDEFPSDGYRIEPDGSLYAMDGSSDFLTRKKYTDFDLRWEWKLSKGANSGVMIHVAEVAHYPHDSGPEYQIIDDDRIHISSTGSLYGLVTPNDKAKINPAGEWNTSRILVHDSKVQHYLNGELVVEYVWGSEYIKEQINKSKFKSWKHFMKQETGHIGFQSHGNDLWFRNIKIKELPEPMPTAAADQGDVQLLKKIEAASDKLNTLKTRVRYTRLQGLTGDEQRRFGDFYYAAGDDKSPTRFAVMFDRLVIDERARPMKTWFIFDGNWLLERDHDDKTAVRRELVPKGAPPSNTLNMGKGQLPIPLKLKADEVLKQYKVEKLKDVPFGDQTLHHLKLTPRKGGKDATPMQLWFDSKTLLLQKIVTEEDGDEIEMLFPTPKLNPKIDDEVFDTALPKKEDGWQNQEVPIQN